MMNNKLSVISTDKEYMSLDLMGVDLKYCVKLTEGKKERPSVSDIKKSLEQ